MSKLKAYRLGDTLLFLSYHFRCFFGAHFAKIRG